jgi:hypothetical protein
VFHNRSVVLWDAIRELKTLKTLILFPNVEGLTDALICRLKVNRRFGGICRLHLLFFLPSSRRFLAWLILRSLRRRRCAVGHVTIEQQQRNGVFCAVITRAVSESYLLYDSARKWKDGWWVRELQFSRCWLLLEFGSSGRVIGNLEPLPGNDYWRQRRLRKLSACCSEL